MAVIKYVQNDRNPLRHLLFRGASADAGVPIDVSPVGVSVRANIAFDGALKEAIVCAKSPGLYKGEDRRTGLWVVDSTAPYDVAGKGGIVLVYPSATTFDQPGVYTVEYEIIASGLSETVQEVDEVHVRKEIG